MVANRICSLLWIVRPNCVAFMHFKDENLDRNNYVSDSSRTFDINFVHYECETNDDRNLSSLDCVELWGHLCFRLREYWLFFVRCGRGWTCLTPEVFHECFGCLSKVDTIIAVLGSCVRRCYNSCVSDQVK